MTTLWVSLFAASLAVCLVIAIFRIRKLRLKLRAYDIASVGADAAWTQAMDALDYPMYLVDLNDNLVRANTAFYKSSGRNPEDCIGHDIRSLIHLKAEDTPCPGCQARLDRRDAFFTKEADDPFNPTGHPIEVNIKVIRDSFNEPIGIIQSIRDLSHLRDTENALRERQALLTQAQSMAHMGDWECELDSNKWHWSEESLRILNQQVEDNNANLPLEHILPLIHPGDRVLVEKSLRETRSPDQALNIRFRTHRIDGSIRHILCRGEVLLSVKDKPTKLVGILQDITDYKTTEDQLLRHKLELTTLVEDRTAELRQALRDAEHANRAKTAFLSNISHELRTPLNAIIGYSQLMAEELVDNVPLHEDATRILSAGHQLLAIVNDLLDITAIEASRTVLELSNFSIPEVIVEVRETLQLALNKNNNQFLFDNQLSDSVIFADMKRVRQALMNVISNANKFTQNGKIAIEIRQDEQSPADWVCIEVNDTGIGMSEEQVQHIFEVFTQGDLGLDRRFGGTGIGLNLTSRLWRMMGGKIDVRSELGKGSSFQLRIPRSGQESTQAA